MAYRLYPADGEPEELDDELKELLKDLKPGDGASHETLSQILDEACVRDAFAKLPPPVAESQEEVRRGWEEVLRRAREMKSENGE
jgi:hypothetical protein